MFLDALCFMLFKKMGKLRQFNIRLSSFDIVWGLYYIWSFDTDTDCILSDLLGFKHCAFVIKTWIVIYDICCAFLHWCTVLTLTKSFLLTLTEPCTVNREDMSKHNIQFRYVSDDKLYSEHNDVIEFICSRGRRVGSLEMRQTCIEGVMHLPTCQ